MDRFEFGSPEWLQATCDIAAKQLADSGVDLSGVTYTFGEELYNLPDRINPTGADRVGWYVRIVDGIVSTVPEVPPADTDSNNICDWDAIEPFAHLSFTDAESAADLAPKLMAVISEGKLQVVTTREQPAALAEALGGEGHALHNAVVAITGPRGA